MLRMLAVAMALLAPSATPPPTTDMVMTRTTVEAPTLQLVKYDLAVVRADVPEVTVMVVRTPARSIAGVSRLLLSQVAGQASSISVDAVSYFMRYPNERVVLQRRNNLLRHPNFGGNTATSFRPRSDASWRMRLRV